MFQSLVEHLLISLQLSLQLLIPPILPINRSDVPYIADPSIIIPLELLLVGLDLLPQFSPFPLDIGYHGLDLLLG